MHNYTKYNLEMMKAREWTGKIVLIYHDTAYSRQVHHYTAYSRQVHHYTAYSRQVHYETAYSRQIKCLSLGLNPRISLIQVTHGNLTSFEWVVLSW